MLVAHTPRQLKVCGADCGSAPVSLPSASSRKGARGVGLLCARASSLAAVAGGCRAVAYCCQQHQKDDWKRHKRACRAATESRKKLEAEAEDDEAAETAELSQLSLD